MGWEIIGLASDQPYPDLKEKQDLYGQIVGDWDILECRSLEEDGSWSSERGKVHWRWILEGRAVQDVWSTIDKASGREIPGGTTVRFYDQKIDAWKSVWISPVQGVVKVFTGRKTGDEIIVVKKRNDEDKEGYLVKWIFSEITRDSFRWRAERSYDSGRTWEMNEEMRIRRSE